MNKKKFLFIGVIVVVAAAMFLFMRLSGSWTQPSGTDTNGPVASPLPITEPGNTAVGTTPVGTQTGGSIQVRDFKKDPRTVKDPENPGYYYLGYHSTEGGTNNIPYIIAYIEPTTSFTIGLFKEPISKSRKEAEQYLMENLGISGMQMCQLKYIVSVPTDVNEFYASQDLRFSFCPDAVAIPE